ncbi:MAG: DNA methyltransferase [Phycisphaerales bacterium]|nr:DNA methyltransferase [Phycisphaerales bacterium]
MTTVHKLTNNIKMQNNNLAILKKHFSHCFDKDGNFQIEKFTKNLADNEINFSKESYNLDWLGKSYARLLACDSTTTLLKPIVIHNTKPKNAQSQNLLIKGDNLEVLKHLAQAYHEKIKMIYIDPPYNTGSDGFVYNDDRKFTAKDLQNLIGIDEEKATRILDFTQSKSNSHSAWLTFMYPRLYIAKQLLKDDGIIFISIDDNEVAQLRLLMDEVFGEENFVAELPTIMNLKGNNDEFGFAGTHEYSIVYSKNKSNTIIHHFHVNDEGLEDWTEDEFGFYKQGANLKATGINAPMEKRPNLFFPIFIDSKDKVYVTDDNNVPNDCCGELKTIYPVTNETNMSWRWSKDKIRNEKENIIVSRNGNIGIYKKQRPTLGDLPTKKPKTIFYKPEYSSGNGTAQMINILGDKYFSNPKPLNLIKDFLEIGSSPNDIILDFFAGSGTTGDAVMQLNAEEGGNRKYILVQLPEVIDPNKNKVAYDFVKEELKAEPTIFEITKERLIRAAKKTKDTIFQKIEDKRKEIKIIEGKLDLEDKEKTIKQLQTEINTLENQDLGFKIFETIPIWNDYDFEAEQFDTTQTLFDTGKLSEDDINALLTTWKTADGILLAQDLDKVDLDTYTAYYGNNKLYLMHKGFTTDNLKTLLHKIDSDKAFNPTTVIAFGYHFDSKHLRELAENLKSYVNRKNIDIDFIIRY